MENLPLGATLSSVNMLELLASDMTQEEILADYEDLEAEDLKACLLFAARMFDVKSITPILAA